MWQSGRTDTPIPISCGYRHPTPALLYPGGKYLSIQYARMNSLGIDRLQSFSVATLVDVIQGLEILSSRLILWVWIGSALVFGRWFLTRASSIWTRKLPYIQITYTLVITAALSVPFQTAPTTPLFLSGGMVPVCHPVAGTACNPWTTIWSQPQPCKRFPL